MINWLIIIFTEWLVPIYIYIYFINFHVQISKKSPIMKILARCQFCLLTLVTLPELLLCETNPSYSLTITPKSL